MKYFLFPLIFCYSGATAQDAMPLIQKVWKQQQQIRSISYKLIRNDILVTDDRRQIKGEAYFDLSKNEIEFDIKRLDVQHELFQNTGSLLFIDHGGRQYNVIEKPVTLETIQNQGASQVFVADLFRLDTANAVAYELKDSASYKAIIIRRSDIDAHDVRNRYKVVVIDPKLMLPVKVRLHQETAGKVQDLDYALSDIKFNDSETLNVIRNATVPAGYAQFDIAPQMQEELEVGSVAPEFRLTDTTGAHVTLHSFAGQVVLLDFWEVWCGHCLASMPKVDELYLKYKSRGLTVLGVLLRPQQWDQAKKMKYVTQNHFPQLLGNEQIRAAYKVYSIPHYILIDRKGRIISRPLDAGQTLEEAIKAAL